MRVFTNGHGVFNEIMGIVNTFCLPKKLCCDIDDEFIISKLNSINISEIKKIKLIHSKKRDDIINIKNRLITVDSFNMVGVIDDYMIKLSDDRYKIGEHIHSFITNNKHLRDRVLFYYIPGVTFKTIEYILTKCQNLKELDIRNVCIPLTKRGTIYYKQRTKLLFDEKNEKRKICDEIIEEVLVRNKYKYNKNDKKENIKNYCEILKKYDIVGIGLLNYLKKYKKKFNFTLVVNHENFTSYDILDMSTRHDELYSPLINKRNRGPTNKQYKKIKEGFLKIGIELIENNNNFCHNEECSLKRYYNNCSDCYNQICEECSDKTIHKCEHCDYNEFCNTCALLFVCCVCNKYMCRNCMKRDSIVDKKYKIAHVKCLRKCNTKIELFVT
jgi:hypothetical protein